MHPTLLFLMLTSISEQKEALASVEAIKRDCRNCPSCATPIYRVSGCPQMWCTSCNTAFCWNTGRIYTNNNHVHNPHYAEFLARTRGAASAADPPPQCQGQDHLMSENDVQRVFAHGPGTLARAARLLRHVKYETMTRLPERDVFRCGSDALIPIANAV